MLAGRLYAAMPESNSARLIIKYYTKMKVFKAIINAIIAYLHYRVYDTDPCVSVGFKTFAIIWVASILFQYRELGATSVPQIGISIMYMVKSRSIVLKALLFDVYLLTYWLSDIALCFYNKQTKALTHDICSASTPVVISKEHIAHLPSIVQQWLIKCGCIDHKYIYNASVEETGEIKLNPDQDWVPCEATQCLSVKDPAFIWDVVFELFGMTIVGRDSFIHGKGSMLIKLLGLLNIVNVSENSKINESALLRYLAEISLFPTAALSELIQWEETKEPNIAMAVMRYKGIEGVGYFVFNDKAELMNFTANRYKSGSDEKRTLWRVKVKSNQQCDGLVVPRNVEVSWIENDKEFTWYRMECRSIKYS